MPRSRVAFIGTRRFDALPGDVAEAFRQAAMAAARAGAIVVTGAAPGADQVAATLALSLGGRVDLVLPWASYEQAWVRWARAHSGVAVVTYDPATRPEWRNGTLRHHPAPGRVSGGALALLARDYGVVSGSDLVVAVPKDPAGRRGGTAHGLRIARALGVPALNLWNERDRAAVADALTVHAPHAPAAW